MSRALWVHILPSAVSPESFRGGLVVVIDVLRASTTIATALSNGASYVQICSCAQAAVIARRELRGGTQEQSSALLGGERGGVIIEGFDLGNSPLDYTPERVAGRPIFFTTTNGTAAAEHAKLASTVVFGAIVNAEAIAAYALEYAGDVHLLCAGTRGNISRDDLIGAGLIAAAIFAGQAKSLTGARPGVERLVAAAGDGIGIALEMGESARREGIEAALRETIGGRDLIALGYDADIAAAARLDGGLREVPVLELTTFRTNLARF